MTAIAAVKHRGKVYMGADSAAVAGYSLAIRDDAKIFRNGPMIFGFTSSFRMGQLLRYSLTLPERPPSAKDTFGWLATSFVNAVRCCLKDGGFARKENEVESAGVFLVGYQGNIYGIDSDYHVGSCGDFAAVGCGADLVLGSLFSTKGKDPGTRLRMSLEAAECFSAGVRGPFHFLREP